MLQVVGATPLQLPSAWQVRTWSPSCGAPPPVASQVYVASLGAMLPLLSAIVAPVSGGSGGQCTSLADAPVTEASRKARVEAEHLRESGEMDAERWRAKVEEPVRRLGRETMPQLSDGWGLSVGLVGAGVATICLATICLAVSVGALPPKDPAGALLVSLVGFLAAMPFLLAMDPAGVSSKCARLEDDINAICGEDPRFIQASMFLKHVQSLNRQQGLG